jgi:outer membrane protein OmpA-like peptidoglycan-associated protein
LAQADPRLQESRERMAFMSRIATRSFGESRPTEHSACTEATGWQADRRVVISVQLATENGHATE